MMNILAIPALWYIRNFQGSIDESFNLLDKLNLKSEIIQGNWKSVENKMSKLSPNQFSRVILELCSGKILNKEIETFIETSQSDFGNLIAGCYYTSIAYIKRSGAWAKELSENQINGMYEFLDMAEKKLDNDFDNDLYQLEASGRMIGILLNTGTIEDATFFLERSRLIDNSHWLSHDKYFRISTPRWGGSDEDMISLINSTKDDSLKILLRLMTLVEMFTNFYQEDNESAVQKFKEDQKFLIKEALDNSVISKSDTIVTIYTKNYLAMLFNILGMYKDRDRLIVELNSRITKYPWAYFGMLCERDVKIYKFFGALKFL